MERRVGALGAHEGDEGADPVLSRPRVVVHTRATTEFAVLSWLLCAADDREAARREWESEKMTLLRCGALFSAVRISGELVRAAAGMGQEACRGDASRIDAFLATALQDGPVVVDSYAARYYALVPASTCRWWHVPETECLGPGAYLGVPRPGLDDPHCVRSYWSVPMESPGSLCSPSMVRALVLNAKALAAVQRRELEAGCEL
ncbi:hypothetical protein ACIRD8_27130 [Streptomyces sp. NPDC102451]|uniref:hypothetical protein n=1 Tax=Streptomyces sp. NPDC102451 TaxID=3366177 RepID=UPI003806A8B5